MIIYEFCYNPNFLEDSYATISLHKTKEGAEKAIEKHKGRVMRNEQKKFPKHTYQDLMQFRDWAIFEMELLD